MSTKDEQESTQMIAVRNHKTTNLLDKVEHFTRDLVEWVLHGSISLPLHTFRGKDGEEWNLNPQEVEFIQNNRNLTDTWFLDTFSRLHHRHPSLDIVSSFGYLTWERTSIGDKYYYPTEKAWELLEQPRRTPRVFISYKRGISSTFALLIETRLRMAGADPERIFIDKDILGGDEWEKLITEELHKAEHFVCLIGKGTLDSSYVISEIKSALENENRRVLPILHSGYTVETLIEEHGEFGEKLAQKHVRVVEGETAAAYEEAVNFVLRSLGYRTYG